MKIINIATGEAVAEIAANHTNYIKLKISTSEIRATEILKNGKQNRMSRSISTATRRF